MAVVPSPHDKITMNSNNNNNSKTTTSRRTQANNALADALAGVAATLVSLWAFYPLEVIKVKLQAAASSSSGSESSGSVWRRLMRLMDDEKTPDSRQRIHHPSSTQQQRLLHRLCRILFQGCPTKSLQAAASSFCYFFIYSWILERTNKKLLHPSKRLLLTCIAAMINTMVTLPLDVLSSQRIVSGRKEKHLDKSNDENTAINDKQKENMQQPPDEHMTQVWKSLHTETTNRTPSSTESDGSSSDEVSSSSCTKSSNSPEHDVFYEAVTAPPPPPQDTINGDHKPKHRTITLSSQSQLDSATSSFPIQLLQRYAKYWKGLLPALLLCTNPAIHYTVYDSIKTRALANGRNAKKQQQLSMPQAFLLGLVAKFCATMVTYPLIRAKVILMVSSSSSSSSLDSLWSTLLQSYRNRTLYQGCDWQLAHTLLKSALMMMVREQVTQSTRRLVVGRTTATTKKNIAAAERKVG